MPFPLLFQREFFGNTLERWILAAGIAAGALIVLTIVQKLVARRAGGYLAQRSHVSAAFVGRLLQRTTWWLVFVVSMWLGAQALALSEGAHRLLRIVVVATLAVHAIRWAVEFVEFGLQAFLAHRRERHGLEDADLTTAAPAVRFLGRLVAIVAIVLLALQNVGVDVTAMIAGLGVGGIAVALAVQNILGDLFGSLSIVLDKPFVVGDFIVVGPQAGTVEKIGLKTTRIRSLSGEQLIFANSDLLGSRIQNYKRMQQRRIVFGFGVSYATPMDVVADIPGIVRTAVESQARTRFDRAHFKAFGESSLDFEAVYWMLDPDFNQYMDVQQAINLAIGRRFAERGIEFAHPVRRVVVVNQAAEEGAPPT